MKRKSLVPFNLQFFAEGEGEGEPSVTPGGEGEKSGSEGEGSTAEGGAGTKDTKEGTAEKTFTQSQVTAMMTREKNQGKKAAIKDLGFKSESEAKQAIKLLNALLDSQKSPEDKAKEGTTKANDEKDEAIRRAEAAENKLACVMAGVSNDSVDDVLAIALLKVTDDKPIDKVLAEMKKEKRYSSFFGSASGDSGTGENPGHSKGSNTGGNAGNYGKRLAQSFSTADSSGGKKKSAFFMED